MAPDWWISCVPHDVTSPSQRAFIRLSVLLTRFPSSNTHTHTHTCAHTHTHPHAHTRTHTHTHTHTLRYNTRQGGLGFSYSITGGGNLSLHHTYGRSEERRVGKECRSRWS